MAAAGQERCYDAREDRDAQTAGDTDNRPTTFKIETATERAEQVEAIAVAAACQPVAAGSDDIKDEPDPLTSISPGHAVGPAQQRVLGIHLDLDELAGMRCPGNRRMMDDQLDGALHGDRAFHDKAPTPTPTLP
jgi:hypothetical protein